MDKKAIKKALDHFENDQFVDAKEIISKEISGHRDVFLKDKLGLAQDINPAPAEPDDKTDDKTNDDGDE